MGMCIQGNQLTFNAGGIVNSSELSDSFMVIFEVQRAAAVTTDDSLRKKNTYTESKEEEINKKWHYWQSSQHTKNAKVSSGAHRSAIWPARHDSKGSVFTSCHTDTTEHKSESESDLTYRSNIN